MRRPPPRAALVKSATAKRPHRGELGLSLVEVLVTLSISALAAVVIITTARPADPLRSEGERLTRTLEQLNGRARISGKPTGLVVDTRSYRGVVWTDGNWTTLPRTERSLGSAVVIASPIADPAPARPGRLLADAPQIVFDPLGHSTIAPVILRAKGQELAITLSEPGQGSSP